MSSLRPYQTKTIEDIELQWSQGKRRVLVVAPTGSGKTEVVAHLIRDNPGRWLFLCPWRELVRQAHERLINHGVPTGIMMGKRQPQDDRVIVATIQTAARRKLPEVRGIVCDEAHRSVAAQWSKVLRRYPGALVIGLTATPIRLDGKPLRQAFEVLINGGEVRELIRDGYLVDHLVYGRPDLLDLSKVRIDRRTRDYSQRSLGNAMKKPELYGQAVEEYRRRAAGQPTFTYCVTIPHAEEVAEAFNKAQVPTKLITGSTGFRMRAEIFSDLEQGRIHNIVNVGVLTEGLDFPPLRCIILLRPTLSLALHCQQIGRGMRVVPQKSHCIVLDHAGNFHRHGFATDDRVWSLDGRELQTRQSNPGEQRAKNCPSCGVLVPAMVRTCPHCGYSWIPSMVGGWLVELFPKVSVHR